MTDQVAKTAIGATRNIQAAPALHLLVNRQDTQDLFDRTLDRLEQRVRLQKIIRWTRDPAIRRHRLPLGILCLIGGLFWFLPVLGIWLLPIGLVLIAHDVPRLRMPVARLMIWLEAKCIALRTRWPRERE